jgi:hypothetical protein
MTGAVDTVIWAPDDGWRYHPKHVEQFTDINKLHIVASCWTVIDISLSRIYIILKILNIRYRNKIKLKYTKELKMRKCGAVIPDQLFKAYSHRCYTNLQSLCYREDGSPPSERPINALMGKIDVFQYCTLYGKMRSFLMLVRVAGVAYCYNRVHHTRQPVGLISEHDTLYNVILFRPTPNNDPLSCSAAMQNACSWNRN